MFVAEGVVAVGCVAGGTVGARGVIAAVWGVKCLCGVMTKLTYVL